MTTIPPGTRAVASHIVERSDTAIAVGSGDVRALATPRLFEWCEETTWLVVRSYCTEEVTSVGVHASLSHRRAVPVGGVVQTVAVVQETECRGVRFTVAATDGDGHVVAEGTIERVTVPRSRMPA